MIAREDLLKTIKTLWQDGQGFAIHQRHILQAMPWYGFTPEEEQTVRATLDALAAKAEDRAHMLEKIYKTLSEKEADVY